MDIWLTFRSVECLSACDEGSCSVKLLTIIIIIIICNIYGPCRALDSLSRFLILVDTWKNSFGQEISLS